MKIPEWYFNLGVGAGSISASELWSLHRGWIEDMAQPIGAGVRGRAMAAKGFAPALYAEELRRMGERRAAFNAWMAPYDALLTPALASGAIPVAEVDETSPALSR